MLLNSTGKEILRKNKNGFRTNISRKPTTGKMLTIRHILEGLKSKNLPLTLLFIDFSKAFDTKNRKNMKVILLKYGIGEVTVRAIMMIYNNTRSMVRSPDGDTCMMHLTLKYQLGSYSG